MLSSLAIAWATLAVLMTAVWGLCLWLKNPGIVDVFWSIAIAVAGLIFALPTASSTATLLTCALLLIWCMRLSGFLFLTRILKQHVDPRYTKLSEGWKISKSLGFWLNYQLQALLALLIAVPFIWVASASTIGFWQVLGWVLIIAGVTGEHIADRQLQRFKQSNSGNICDIGLWAYSRHPNYFFEWLVWLGFASCAIHSAWSLFALLSPAALLFIFLKITGPITERGSIERKGQAYIDYQKRTSMFVPWKF